MSVGGDRAVVTDLPVALTGVLGWIGLPARPGAAAGVSPGGNAGTSAGARAMIGTAQQLRPELADRIPRGA